MKKILILLFISTVIFSAYKPNDNDHVRFGVPGRSGIIVPRQGFVSCYSKEFGMPLWVSYQIQKPDLKSKRPAISRQYISDPKVKSGTTAPEKYSGIAPYESAKMAPVKHMGDKETMKESYMTSNVCPMHEVLSRGAWFKLENMIYNFSLKHGSLWVVSGPVFDEKVRYTKTSLRVPSAFFKVIIFQHADYSFRTCAFVFQNSSAAQTLSECMVKVSRVESLTGLKFMTALPEEARRVLQQSGASSEDLAYLAE